MAWLTLDRDDNDPGRFLRHLAAALQEIDDTLQALGDFVGDDAGAALTTIVNDVSENVEDLAQVLDDYHLIEASKVHEALRFLIKHAPEQLHLIIATRSEPPLPLARLRVRGELTELRTEALRFTAEEVGELTAGMQLALSRGDSIELAQRTEGWAAGLQLAALSLQGRDDASNFIPYFTGTDPYVLAYLTEEVLLKQDDEIQTFLLLTSVLDRFCPELADVVTEQRGGLQTIEKLERAGLFLSPLDRQRRWFRYHSLFQELLRHRLEAARPALVPTLHGRAARWFAANEYPAAALRHALLADDSAGAAEVIAAHPEAEQIRHELNAFLKRNDGGGPLSELVAAAVAAGISLEQRGCLFDTFERPAAARLEAGPTERWSEPLSAREQQVLVLVSAGLSNKQIAQRLDISLNTVKTHTKNIYKPYANECEA